MGDEHLDTISATKSDEFIKSSVENLILISSESEGILDNMCDVPFHDNSLPHDISKDQFEDFVDSNDEFSSTDDDSFSIDNIEYVEASLPDSELVSSEVMEIVIPEVGGIDDDILLTIKDDILCEKLLNINILIANIEALNDNPTPSFDFMSKSSSTSINSPLEETNTFDNSLPEFETFCFDLEKISSGSTTTRSDISLPEYEAFYDDHVKETSSGKYDCFFFKIKPNSGDFTMDVVEDISPIKEPRVHNALPTHPTLQLNLEFKLSSESLFTYVSPTLLSTSILNRVEYFGSRRGAIRRRFSTIAPPSPDYIPGPEEPQILPAPQDEDEHEPMFIQPHDPDFVPEPIYPEYIPLDDEHIHLAEEQPLPPVVSPTAESPGYVAESDPEEDSEEYKDDETEDDDADDEDEDEEEEEVEEHLAPADFDVVIPTDELVSLPKGAESAAISFPPEAEVERLLAMPTPSPSPFTSLSPPSVGERLARCTAPAALPSSPLPPPLHMPPPVDRRDDIPETEMPPRKRLCLSTLGFRYKVGESFTSWPIRGRGIDYGFVRTLDAEARRRGIGEVGYGIRDTWIDPTETVPEIAPMTMREVNTRVTKLVELHEHDTQDLYALLGDAQDSRTRIS
nr:hypothetical protein [Tanacetum cinerariifolium]